MATSRCDLHCSLGIGTVESLCPGDLKRVSAEICTRSPDTNVQKITQVEMRSKVLVDVGVHDACKCCNESHDREMQCFQPKRDCEVVQRPANDGEVMARERVQSEHDAELWLGPGFARMKVSVGRSRSTSSRCGSRSERTNCF